MARLDCRNVAEVTHAVAQAIVAVLETLSLHVVPARVHTVPSHVELDI